jgi:hypothetical protein
MNNQCEGARITLAAGCRKKATPGEAMKKQAV